MNTFKLSKYRIEIRVLDSCSVLYARIKRSSNTVNFFELLAPLSLERSWSLIVANENKEIKDENSHLELVTNKYSIFLAEGAKRRWNIGVKRPCLIAVVIEVMVVVGNCLKCFRRRWRSYRSPQSSIVPRDKCFSLPLWGRVRFRSEIKDRLAPETQRFNGVVNHPTDVAPRRTKARSPARRIFRDESALC